MDVAIAYELPELLTQYKRNRHGEAIDAKKASKKEKSSKDAGTTSPPKSSPKW